VPEPNTALPDTDEPVTVSATGVEPHTCDAEGVTLIAFGNELTVTVTVAVFTHPVPLSVAVTVYVVVAAGVTVCCAPVRLPGIHT